jgi:hypothetical protein
MYNQLHRNNLLLTVLQRFLDVLLTIVPNVLTSRIVRSIIFVLTIVIKKPVFCFCIIQLTTSSSVCIPMSLSLSHALSLSLSLSLSLYLSLSLSLTFTLSLHLIYLYLLMTSSQAIQGTLNVYMTIWVTNLRISW